jgi:uncharacterized protein GlcG (DUF336 family)
MNILKSLIFVYCTVPFLLQPGRVLADATGAPSGTVMAAPRGPALDLALEAAVAARSACISQHVSVAVVDSEGEITVLLASDGAPPIFADLAWRKARTAVHFKMPSKTVSKMAASDPKLFFQLSSALYSYYGGGLPLYAGLDVIGAIALSGAPNESADEACAQAGIDKIKTRLK